MCRHAVAAVGPFIFIYGGLVGSTLHSDLLLADDGCMKDMATYDARSPPWMKWLESTNQAASMLARNAAEEAKAAGSIMMHRAAIDATEGTSADDLAEEAEAAAEDAAQQRQLANNQSSPSGNGEEGEQQVCISFPALHVVLMLPLFAMIDKSGEV
jgi:protein phosphatase